MGLWTSSTGFWTLAAWVKGKPDVHAGVMRRMKAVDLNRCPEVIAERGSLWMVVPQRARSRWKHEHRLRRSFRPKTYHYLTVWCVHTYPPEIWKSVTKVKSSVKCIQLRTKILLVQNVGFTDINGVMAIIVFGRLTEHEALPTTEGNVCRSTNESATNLDGFDFYGQEQQVGLVSFKISLPGWLSIVGSKNGPMERSEKEKLQEPLKKSELKKERKRKDIEDKGMIESHGSRQEWLKPGGIWNRLKLRWCELTPLCSGREMPLVVR